MNQVINIVGNNQSINNNFQIWTDEQPGEILSEDLGDNINVGVSSKALCTLTDIGLDQPYRAYTFHAELINGIENNPGNNTYSERIELRY